jgi:hypothetical protein
MGWFVDGLWMVCGWFVDASLFYCTAMELLGRDSQKTAVKMTTNLIIIFTSTLRYTACISCRPSTYKMTVKVRTYFSCLLAFRTVTTSVSASPYLGLFTEHKGEFHATVNTFCYN